jgi:ADP-ribose pyrophosphatase YjhB (NUDIX family)
VTVQNPIGAHHQWLAQEQYDFIVARVPILCVDLIAFADDGESRQVGLINRAVPEGGTGWCLVGGRVLRDEPLENAVRRHLRATLGSGIEVDPATLRPAGVIEYFSQTGIGEFCDPRKHAVSVTYAGRCTGQAQVQQDGEATDFRWYSPEQLPDLRFGCGQDKIIGRFLSQRSAALAVAR